VVKIGAGGRDFVAVFGNVKNKKHSKKSCHTVKQASKNVNKACKKKSKGKKK
jgi:hypothetical protein